VDRPLVCIQGLGFVGAAMAVACARAGTRSGGEPAFDVVGLDLATPLGEFRINAINEGDFPFQTTDSHLMSELAAAHSKGNLKATKSANILEKADVVVVDVPFDLDNSPGAKLDFAPFCRAIETIGQRARAGTLVVVETTVPPGTTERVVAPLLSRCALSRGLGRDAFLLAHAYERVMPGRQYLSSITDFWRVFAGVTPAAADACEAFLSKVVNVRNFPLRRMSTPTASETAKVVENSYRAVNIALMDEWGRFAERVGVDMFEIVEAIRQRPTHNNIRQPGFGVGGYCLTKDPLFGYFAARDLYGSEDIDFPVNRQAVKINGEMPLNTARLLEECLGGSLASKTVLLAGISYREDVADTRYSPAETLYRFMLQSGARIVCWDPMVTRWTELDVPVLQECEFCPEDVDAVVFTIPHNEFKSLSPVTWLRDRTPIVIEASNIFSDSQRADFRAQCQFRSIGRGG